MGNILTPPGTGDTVTEDYNEIFATDSESKKRSKLESWIAKNIGEKIVQHYNNREWKVIVDLEQQILIIGCDSISNTKGYHIHMKQRNIHELTERAVMAAGEILERHQLSREKKFNADILETLKRDNLDNVIASDSAAEPV